MGKNKNLIIIVVALVLVVAGVYFYMSRDTSSTDALTSTDPSVTAVGDTLLSSLGQLRSITLDPSLFASPVFQSLNDFSSTLTPQPAGRTNPFSPIDPSLLPAGVSAAAVSTQ